MLMLMVSTSGSSTSSPRVAKKVSASGFLLRHLGPSLLLGRVSLVFTTLFSTATFAQLFCPDCAPYNFVRVLDSNTGKGTGWYDSRHASRVTPHWENCPAARAAGQLDHEACAVEATKHLMDDCAAGGCHAVMRVKSGETLETTELVWPGESWGGPKTKTESLTGPDSDNWPPDMMPAGWIEAGVSSPLAEFHYGSDTGQVILSLRCQARPCQLKDGGNYGWGVHSVTGLLGHGGTAKTIYTTGEDERNAYNTQCRKNACCAGVGHWEANFFWEESQYRCDQCTLSKCHESSYNRGQTVKQPLGNYLSSPNIVSENADALPKPPRDCVGTWDFASDSELQAAQCTGRGETVTRVYTVTVEEAFGGAACSVAPDERTRTIVCPCTAVGYEARTTSVAEGEARTSCEKLPQEPTTKSPSDDGDGSHDTTGATSSTGSSGTPAQDGQDGEQPRTGDALLDPENAPLPQSGPNSGDDLEKNQGTTHSGGDVDAAPPINGNGNAGGGGAVPAGSPLSSSEVDTRILNVRPYLGASREDGEDPSEAETACCATSTFLQGEEEGLLQAEAHNGEGEIHLLKQDLVSLLEESEPREAGEEAGAQRSAWSTSDSPNSKDLFLLAV
ncbi:unnamed protein product [Amoebophrya sp. A120]|nr:unnamed protein product [Amoebophrya sp. A120]|eukprot:GSA120T00013712001.1